MTALAPRHDGAAGASRPVSRPLRLALFTSHPIQYQAPLFRVLASEPGIDLVVFFGSRFGEDPYLDRGFSREVEWDVPLLDGYKYVFLDNRSPRPSPTAFFGVWVPEIQHHLVSGRFDAFLLLGWYTAGHIQAALAAYLARLPILVRGESNLETHPASPLATRLRRLLWLPVRRCLYRAAFRHVEAVVAIGSRNAAFYGSFDVPRAKLRSATYGVENGRFTLEEDERERARAAIRSKIGLPSDAIVYLSVGKLVGYKRPHDIIAAFRRSMTSKERSFLVFVGDGPLRRPLASSASAHPELKDRVIFAGFVNQAELPRWYAAADCLLLASDSRETWGLVVNEAMAAGLPVIVSRAAGCAPDLVRDGENGWLYSVGRVDELAERIACFQRLPAEARSSMGEASLRLVAKCTPQEVARVLAAAAVMAASNAGAR